MLKARNIFKRPVEPVEPVEPPSDTDSISDDEMEVVKEKSRRPHENNFTQQKLKAFHPIITPKYVIPLFLGLAIFLIPLGAAMLYGARQVQDVLLYYNHCDTLASSDHFSDMPASEYEINFHSSAAVPKWKYVLNESETDTDEQGTCQLQFTVPNDMGSPLYMLYRVDNFYANHRRFARSYSEDQLEGKAASLSTIKDNVGQNCQPLSENEDGVKYYPCGLIANSLFNDTFTSLYGVNSTSENYTMTTDGIAWATNHHRFRKTNYNHTEVVPPPNWIKMFPDGYTEDNMPDISTWSEFQNWVQAPALSKFSKLVRRNDNETLSQGTYGVTAGMHWPVNEFKGRKAVYITTRSATGGRNPFLGVCWIVIGGICLVVGIMFLIIHFAVPRKLGDISRLSWNKED